jgi:hypothetical protein
MGTTLLAQRLVALFAAGWLALSFPLLGLALGGAPAPRVLGLPLWPLALFGGWALVIALLAWCLEGSSDA